MQITLEYEQFGVFAQLYNVKTYLNFSTLKQVLHHTVVGDNINIMKTTFELNFDFLTSF